MNELKLQQEVPLISVAICTYNGSRYIEDQLQSILNQTYNNIEIIICDDLSTDNTVEIIKRYASEHQNIRYYVNEKNLGFNSNFEQAIKLCSGEYIAVSDQDDIWSPVKIDRLFEKIGDNWLIFSNSAFMDNKSRLTAGTLLDPLSLEQMTYKNILLMNFVTGHTILMRRCFLAYCLPFPPVKFYDWWIGFIALYHRKVTYVDEVLTYYRVHPLSVVQKQRIESSSKNHEAQLLFETVCNQMRCFQNYPLLNQKDVAFIRKLREAYIKRRRGRSLQLLKMMILKGKQLHPPSFKKMNTIKSALHYSTKL